MIVYIWGNLTAANFTPRPGKDTIGGPGQQLGLSASESLPAGRKGREIDTELLGPMLKAFPDKLEEGGTSGHVAIAPVSPSGELDKRMLEEWALSRGTAQLHPLTQMLLDAVVRPNVRSDQ